MAETDKFLATCVKMLEKERELTKEFNSAIEAIQKDRAKIGERLTQADTLEEIPDIICEDDPYLAWMIGTQNDAFAIRLYRNLRDKVQADNRKAKDSEGVTNFFKDKIGNWLLETLNKSGAKSVNCGEAGKAHKKLDVRATAADWDAFLKWAADNEAGDAVQKRINSSFIKKYEEEHDELPPFIDVYKEFKIVVTK